MTNNIYYCFSDKSQTVLLIVLLLSCTYSSYSQSFNNYQYDEEGRLTADLSEGIASIEWNSLDKVAKVIRADTSHAADLEFAYDALGNRIMKLVKPRSGQGLQPENTWEYTYYVTDLHGNPQAIYSRRYEPQGENYKEHYQVSEHAVYGTSRSGLEKPANGELVHRNFSATFDGSGRFSVLEEQQIIQTVVTSDSVVTVRGIKDYELNNHLHNVLAVVNDRKSSGTVDQKIISNYFTEEASATDYYPFGMPLAGRSVNHPAYRYGFNEKEKDNEVNGTGNSYDFGARMYDSRLGKWLSEDPRQAKYPFASPYVFVLNSPLLFVDPDGRDLNRYNGGKSTPIEYPSQDPVFNLLISSRVGVRTVESIRYYHHLIVNVQYLSVGEQPQQPFTMTDGDNNTHVYSINVPKSQDIVKMAETFGYELQKVLNREEDYHGDNILTTAVCIFTVDCEGAKAKRRGKIIEKLNHQIEEAARENFVEDMIEALKILNILPNYKIENQKQEEKPPLQEEQKSPRYERNNSNRPNWTRYIKPPRKSHVPKHIPFK